MSKAYFIFPMFKDTKTTVKDLPVDFFAQKIPYDVSSAVLERRPSYLKIFCFERLVKFHFVNVQNILSCDV